MIHAIPSVTLSLAQCALHSVSAIECLRVTVGGTDHWDGQLRLLSCLSYSVLASLLQCPRAHLVSVGARNAMDGCFRLLKYYGLLIMCMTRL